MKDLKNALVGLIDTSSLKAKKLIDSFNEIVDSFDMDAQIDFFNERKKELIARGNGLFVDFSELLKRVKNTFDVFSVTVQYDKSIGEELSYDVKDGKLNVEVSYSDENVNRNSSTSVVIPSDCDTDKINLTTNDTTKTATIWIPKKGDAINKTTTKNPKNTSKSKLKRDSKGRFVRRTP